jgi:DUF218 domain
VAKEHLAVAINGTLFYAKSNRLLPMSGDLANAKEPVVADHTIGTRLPRRSTGKSPPIGRTAPDAVVVLGGGLEYRPFIAADLYRKGLVSKVLVSRAPEVHLGALPWHTELNRKALLKLGVPDAAIEIFGTENRNTEDEVLALRDWAEQNAASVLIVPSEIFSARRVRWIFHRQFRGTAVRIEIPSFEEDFTRAGWWKTKAGLIAFQTEVLKYIYYRFKD